MDSDESDFEDFPHKKVNNNDNNTNNDINIVCNYEQNECHEKDGIAF